MRKTVLAGMPLAIMPLVTMLALGGCSEPAPTPEVEETPMDAEPAHLNGAR